MRSAPGRGKFEQFLVGQVIENDHLGSFEDLLSPKRQKTRVSRSGPNEIDFAFFHCILFSNSGYRVETTCRSRRVFSLRPDRAIPRRPFCRARPHLPWAQRARARNNCLPSSEATRPAEFDSVSGKARIAANGDLAAALQFLEQTAFGANGDGWFPDGREAPEDLEFYGLRTLLRFPARPALWPV